MLPALVGLSGSPVEQALTPFSPDPRNFGCKTGVSPAFYTTKRAPEEPAIQTMQTLIYHDDGSVSPAFNPEVVRRHGIRSAHV